MSRSVLEAATFWAGMPPLSDFASSDVVIIIVIIGCIVVVVVVRCIVVVVIIVVVRRVSVRVAHDNHCVVKLITTVVLSLDYT